MADIENMAYGILDNASDLEDIWVEHPERRKEFGAREVFDLVDAFAKLSRLLEAIGAKEVV